MLSGKSIKKRWFLKGGFSLTLRIFLRMKTLSIIVAIILLPCTLLCEDIVGIWHGKISKDGNQTEIIINIKKRGELYNARLTSPQQAIFDIPADSVIYKNTIIKIYFSSIFVEYSGVLIEKRFIGKLVREGSESRLNLVKKYSNPIKREQEPAEPYPYIQENILFSNIIDSIDLAGTITRPNDNNRHTSILLISGVGPQDRNHEMMSHKPFLIIADRLTREGYAVLRYDDRGIGESGGSYDNSSSKDFANDAKAAIHYLKNKNFSNGRVGIIGISEGALIASMIASKDSSIEFIVLLSAELRNGEEVLLEEQKRAAMINGASLSEAELFNSLTKDILFLVKNYRGEGDLEDLISEKINAVSMGAIPLKIRQKQAKMYSSPWMKFYISCNPIEYIKRVQSPVLALYGERDSQIEPQTIIKQLDSIGIHNLTCGIIADANNLFQSSMATGSDYYQNPQTISESLITAVIKWINKLTNEN